MNLFLLSYNIDLCAQWHCDKHVVKMILELTQMLYTAHHLTNDQVLVDSPGPYKCTHKNHPMTKWVRETKDNYRFVTKLAQQLVNEFIYRYGHGHKCSTHIEWLADNIPAIEDKPMTEVPQCMPDEFKVPGDPVQGYKNYYLGAKQDIANWKKNRPEPEWWVANSVF